MSAPDIRYVDANGLRFAYLEEGSGPLVLLCHGFPDTARTWDDLRGRLATAGYRAVSPYMRGYSPTAVPDRDVQAVDLGNDVVALIEALGESSAIVIGHDWGGMAAYAAMALAPDRLEHAFVIDVPHPLSHKPSPKFLWHYRHFIGLNLPGAAGRLRRDDFALVRTLVRRWSPDWDITESELEEIRESLRPPGCAEAAVSYYRMLRSGGPDPLFKERIHVPTTAVPCIDHTEVPRAWYEAAARRFEAPYEVVGISGGHFAHRANPDEIAELVLSRL